MEVKDMGMVGLGLTEKRAIRVQDWLLKHDAKVRKAGIREVVEWFMKYGGDGPIQYSDGIKARFDPPWDELQAKLKEWEI